MDLVKSTIIAQLRRIEEILWFHIELWGQYNEESFLIYATIYATTFKKKINVIRSLLTYLQKIDYSYPRG